MLVDATRRRSLDEVPARIDERSSRAALPASAPTPESLIRRDGRGPTSSSTRASASDSCSESFPLGAAPELSLKVYAAAYVVLARSLGGMLVTADRRLAAAYEPSHLVR